MLLPSSQMDYVESHFLPGERKAAAKRARPQYNASAPEKLAMGGSACASESNCSRAIR